MGPMAQPSRNPSVGSDFRLGPAGEERGGQEGRPGIESEEGRHRIVAGEAGVLLHDGGHATEDLGAHGHSIEIPSAQDADREIPRRRDQRRSRSAPISIPAAASRTRSAHRPGNQARRGDQDGADRPLRQRGESQAGPEDRRRAARGAPAQFPQRRTGRRRGRARGSRRSWRAWNSPPRSGRSRRSGRRIERSSARTSGRPNRHTSRHVAAPARAETSRAPNGLSPPMAVPASISQ